jgi:predicted PurR-regulated permease PerM
MAEKPSPPETRRARLWRAADASGIPLRAILVTVGVVVVTYMAGKLMYRLRDVVLLVAVAGFVALLLNPLVVALQRWKIKRRGFAVTVVTFWALIVFAGLAFAFGYPLINGVTHLADGLPAYINKAEHGQGWIGHLIRHYHVQVWVQKNYSKIVNFGQSLGKPALALGKGAVSLLIALATIFVLVLLLLLEGPKLRAGLLGAMSPARRESVTSVASQVNRAVTGYMLGNFLTSLIAGLVVFTTLLLLGVPYPLLWALWVALVDFLPMIGGALAGIPTVLFAAGHSLTAGIITLIVFLVYTQVENHILNPVIMSRTVRINPLLVLMSILIAASIGSWIGGLFGGFVAALLAIPAAGAVQVIVADVWRVTAPPGQAGAPVPEGAAIVPDQSASAAHSSAAGLADPSVPAGHLADPSIPAGHRAAEAARPAGLAESPDQVDGTADSGAAADGGALGPEAESDLPTRAGRGAAER